VPRPLYLTIAAALTALQGVVLAVWAVLVLVNISTMSVSTAIFFLVYGAALELCAVGLWRLQSWARAPIVLTQLIMLGLAWDSRHSNVPVAIALAVVAIAALACVLHPASLEALSTEESGRP
jgi:hypothetical protein